jgi:hypothetical protein
MKQILNFVKDGMNIDETKISMLMILTFVYAIFLLVMYSLDRKLGSNLVLAFQTLVASILGVNVANIVSSNFNKNE